MPLVINPDFMILDGGEVTAPRMKGPKADVSQVSEADINAAVAQAGADLGVDKVTLAYEAGNTGATVRLNKFTPEELTAYQQGRADKVNTARTTGGGTDVPYEAPDGTHWSFMNGAWKLYKDFTAENFDAANNAGGFNNGSGNNGNGNGNGNGFDSSGNPIITDTTVKPTTNIDIVKAALRGLGFTSAIIDSSTSFLNSLIKEGLDLDNATEVFLNSKEYTLKNGSKIASPFYTEYGYLNEGLIVPKSANELFNTVEGMKGVVDKYKLSSKYLSQDNLKLYFKNDITVTDMANRAAMAELRAIEADPFQVDALIKQGYISSAADLKDFYLDPKVGQQQLELNRQTGVFTAEALRRAKSGISSSGLALDRYKQITATLVAQGYNEAEITKMASTGFENIAQDLNPTVALAQIYEKAGGTGESNALLQSNIQSQLEAEQFGGTASERRKRLAGQNIAAFEGSSGLYSRYGVSGSLSGPGTTGLI
jgi:hypothetical protein